MVGKERQIQTPALQVPSLLERAGPGMHPSVDCCGASFDRRFVNQARFTPPLNRLAALVQLTLYRFPALIEASGEEGHFIKLLVGKCQP